MERECSHDGFWRSLAPPMQDGDHRPRGAVRAAGAGHAQGGRRPLQDRPLRRLHAQTARQDRTHAIE